MGREKRGDRLKVAAAGLAAAGAAAGMAWAVRGRASSVFGPSVCAGPRGRQAIALTFDDGPSAGTLPILEILGKYSARATFFQCGVNILRAEELSRAVNAGGHEIGNHSHTHPNFAFRNAQFIHDDFSRAQDTITEVTGRKPRLLRAPYGVRWFGFRETQRRLGLSGVMWSVIGRDWILPATAVAARVVSAARDGAIVCLHDGRGTLKDPEVAATVEAVRRIVPALLEKGYHFETVSQLLCPMT